MNYQVPSYYPEVPEEVKSYLRVIDEVVVPECIEGNEISTVTPKVGGSALMPSYAMIGDILFAIYQSKEDCWEDAFYDAWYLSEDKEDITLLTDLAIQNIKLLEWWIR
jgi:hypothetical protein